MWVACRYVATGSAPRDDKIGIARPEEDHPNSVDPVQKKRKIFLRLLRIDQPVIMV